MGIVLPRPRHKEYGRFAKWEGIAFTPQHRVGSIPTSPTIVNGALSGGRSGPVLVSICINSNVDHDVTGIYLL